MRSRLLEAYRVLAFPRRGAMGQLSLFDSPTSGPLLECYRVDLGERPEAGGGGRGRRNLRQAVAEGPILQCLRDNNKLVPEATGDDPLVLAPQVVRRSPLWKDGERKLSTEEVWDRLRREPELPMILKPADLLPTFRAGLTTDPEALWTYYNQSDKKVFIRDNALALSPVISSSHFLYDVREAIPDRIMPVVIVTPQEVWDHLWPREGIERVPTATTIKFLEQAKGSNHFPVLPERSILWQSFQEGARENRWVLYMRGPSLAIGSQEMAEWPGTPYFDQNTELWTYQAALDQGIYPRQPIIDVTPVPVTPDQLQTRCWPVGADHVPTEDMERSARNYWPDLSRARLETLLLDGLQAGKWAVWKRGPDETFYIMEDRPFPVIRIGALWNLVDPSSSLARDLEGVRPGRGPQPIKYAGTPREVFTRIWEELGIFHGVQIAEITLTATDRDTLDNTLVATWADRPGGAQSHVSLQAAGQREVQGKQETVDLRFEGRFDETRSMLSPIWPFERQGELDVTVTVQLTFDPPVSMGDNSLERYRTALMDSQPRDHRGSRPAISIPRTKRYLMEQFRLRVRNEPKRGQIWELHLFPNQPHRRFREADGRILGSSSAPEAIYWLRQVADPYLLRAEAPTPITASEFGPGSEPRWLQHEDGMRVALAFSAARWIISKKQRRMFLEGLKNLPSEVVLYWFTLCFYGYQQAAGRAALRTLLTHEEPDEAVRSKDLSPTPQEKPAVHRTYGAPAPDREARLQQAREALGEYSAKLRKQGNEERMGDVSKREPRTHARTSLIGNNIRQGE